MCEFIIKGLLLLLFLLSLLFLFAISGRRAARTSLLARLFRQLRIFLKTWRDFRRRKILLSIEFTKINNLNFVEE